MSNDNIVNLFPVEEIEEVASGSPEQIELITKLIDCVEQSDQGVFYCYTALNYVSSTLQTVDTIEKMTALGYFDIYEDE